MQSLKKPVGTVSFYMKENYLKSKDLEIKDSTQNIYKKL